MVSFKISFTLLLSLASLALSTSIGQADSEAHLAHNFTISALNIKPPNANLTGVPLVLGQDGAIDGAEFYVTSTYSSYPYNDYPALGLVNNSLRAYGKDGRWITNATEVRSGEPLGWISTTLGTSPASQIYSAIRILGHKYPLLAAYGFPHLWSLCPFPGVYPQTNIVFNVSAEGIPPPVYLGYDPSQCYPVLINMVSIILK